MFYRAKPVFLKGLSTAMNIAGVFFCKLPASDEKATLYLAAATRYRAWLNGRLLMAGPARAAHGHARVDEIELDLTNGGELRIDVAGYFLKSYDGVKHPSFLTAEVRAGEAVLAATGSDFEGYRNLSRAQKVMRFSLQRHFSEVYEGIDRLERHELEILPADMKYIPRQAPLPCMDEIRVQSVLSEGSLARVKECTRDPWFIRRIPEHTEGYSSAEIENAPFRDYCTLGFAPDAGSARAFAPMEIGEMRYAAFDFGRVHTGFIQADIEVLEETVLYISHEDYCPEPYIDTKRLFGQYVNMISYHLQPGQYQLEAFDALEMRYLQLNVVKGLIRVEGAGLRQFVYPAFEKSALNSGDEKLDEIYDAAVSTFRQNSLDIFMDCPCRERAGWLCDSYYTAQAEYAFTGDNRLERTFLDNFVDAGQLPGLPEGMIPMCYPADITGSFIPQWAMWYVLELEEALIRCPQMDKMRYKPLCDRLLAFFARYLNGDGLLEGLPGWNFVEWSKCNEWTAGVNYPTNFLYSRFLKAVGSIYGENALLEQCKAVRRETVRRSFDGELFTENALRGEDGQLHNTGNTSETCQYYAIHFGEIDLEEPGYAALKNAFINIFGPDHSKYDSLRENIAPSNAFIGIYLRIECLLALELYDKVLNEIKAFFGNMAYLTGTLWEHDNVESGSLNHGFASYAAAAIVQALNAKE